MPRIVLEMEDQTLPDGTAVVGLKVSHDPFEEFDSEGQPIPPSPAMMAAVFLIEKFKTHSRPVEEVVEADAG